jgi:bifunctional non-homologous end joining protein LigD
MGTMHPAGYEPMLASTGPMGDDRRFGFEPKLDGWRAVVHVEADRVRVFSRPGRDLTSSVPELAAVSRAVPPGTVLDGELVAGSGGASSFYGLGPLLATSPGRRGRSAVAFAAFDVLAVAGRRVVDLSYEQRRELLDDLAFRGPAWCTVPSWKEVSVADMLAVCQGKDVEGLLAKRLASRYHPGRRRPDWLKIKTAEWRAVHAGRRHEQGPAPASA